MDVSGFLTDVSPAVDQSMDSESASFEEDVIPQSSVTRPLEIRPEPRIEIPPRGPREVHIDKISAKLAGDEVYAHHILCGRLAGISAQDFKSGRWVCVGDEDWKSELAKKFDRQQEFISRRACESKDPKRNAKYYRDWKNYVDFYAKVTSYILWGPRWTPY